MSLKTYVSLREFRHFVKIGTLDVFVKSARNIPDLKGAGTGEGDSWREQYLKGLSHEIDFKNCDKILQNLA